MIYCIIKVLDLETTSGEELLMNCDGGGGGGGRGADEVFASVAGMTGRVCSVGGNYHLSWLTPAR